MTKVFKDEKIFNEFKQEFRFIFKDKNFIDFTKNHFNKNGSFAAFTLAFLQNQIGKQRVLDNAKFNSNDWIELFRNLYSNQEIINAFEKLNLNPLIRLENIKEYFKCFDQFIDKLFVYIREQEWSLNISNENVRELLKSGYGYILYNGIECKLNQTIDTILEDKDYDKKYVIILNNTKLFSDIKSCILKNCREKISDLIVILLGGSNHLALNK